MDFPSLGKDAWRKMEYLLHGFDGSLKWLEALKPQLERSGLPPHYKVFAASDMAALERDATALGLKLPPAFIKLFTEEKLMQRARTGDTTLDIAGALRKVPASVDGGAGGYSISMFQEGEAECAIWWCLYLEPDGTHCVLQSRWDTGSNYDEFENEFGLLDRFAVTEEERQEAKRQGREMATFLLYKNYLAGVEFEEWLAELCFESEIGELDDEEYDHYYRLEEEHGVEHEDAREDGHEPPYEGQVREELKEYVRTMYVGS